MTKPSAYDTDRLNHINWLMDNIHTSSSEIYECLVDRDFDSLSNAIKILMTQLEDIQNSITDGD
mgnify:CR=1 FL=1|tara:strand:- start:14255 stop:14446 length:192 start_codon:yes stop_codon:yes gene_type:complete